MSTPQDSTNSLRTLTPDGVEISFLHLGGTGAPILFAHATGFCATVWRPVVEELLDAAGSDFGSCWALDARGHGHSGRPVDGDFAWDGTATDILTVLDAVAAGEAPSDAPTETRSRGRWRGVGHSMGGAALLLAEVAAPETFERLWLFEPIVFPPDLDNSGGAALAAGAARRRASFDSVEAARANYSSKPPMQAFDLRALEGYLERGLRADPSIDGGSPGDSPVMLSCRPEDESAMYLMGGRHDAWTRLGEVACTTTVVRGSDVLPGPATFAPAVAERLPAGTLEAFDHLGHFGPMESPAEVAASIHAAFTATS